jgi:hypothetical protein
MSKTGKILTAIFILGGILIFPAVSQQQWTRADLQSIYMEYLRQEGYVPSVDVDGDIQFKVAGDNYFIIIDDTDLQFFQVYMGFSLDDISQQDALNAANYSNRRSKVVKVALSSEGKIVSITAELLLNDPRDFVPVFSRAISLIRNAENNFMAQLR